MRETIYVVDDSKMNLNIAEKVLSERYQVITLLSAAEMFASMEKLVPDLILLDVVMPEMDGFEALKILKNTHTDIPVIFITSTRDAAVEARGFEMGVTDFITKPFSASVLVNRINSHLERTQKQQENKKLIQEIARQKQDADNANKAKSSFLSRMSHEIRTPMNAILGIAEIQLQEESLELKIREAFERIYASGDLLLSIINDILDLSKIEAGKMELTIGKYEIASLVSDTAQLNMMRVGSKPITFELNIDEHLPATLLGDELRIKQIFNNLLSNAFKYTASGTVTLGVSVEPSHGDEIFLVVTVRDTGQGMSKEQIARLYDDYARFNETANRATEGTGLGMSITRDLVNIMKGSISVESETGLGSTFTIRLPQSRCGGEELGKEMAINLHKFRSNSRTRMIRTQITREPMPYAKVLVVDDVDTNIYVAKGLLAPYELTIDSADSGYAAIDKIKNGKVYDVIFMDHMMPKLDGVETTKILREIGYTHPIIALTANAVAGQASIFLENGFDDFISKPIDIRQMNKILNEQIRDKQPPDVLEEARQKAKTKKPHMDKSSHSMNTAIDPQQAKIFLRETEKPLMALSGPYDRDTGLQNYMVQMQAMKTALENAGKMDLSAAAYKLEQAARDRITELVESETPAFLRAAKTFSETLSKSLETQQAKSIFANRQIAGLDIAKGLERYPGDEKTYITILRSYAASVGSMLDEIKSISAEFQTQAVIPQDKLLAYRTKVHGIKGTSLDIFAEQTGKEARDLEEAAKSSDFDFIKNNTSAFLKNAGKLVAAINDVLLNIDAENPKQKKDKPDENVLLELFSACKKYHINKVDEAMAEIEKYQYEADDGLADWLRENIDSMDFEKIVEKLSYINK